MTIKEVVNYSRDSESFCEAYSIVNADAIVCGALKLEERNMKDLKPEILYVMSYQKMPKALPGNATYNFLILVPDKEMPLQIPEVVRTRCNLLIAESSIDRAMLAVQNIIFDEWRIESSIRLLTEALFTSGITRMLSVGAEQLQCSIILVEQFGKVIEKSEGLKSIPPGTKFAEFWKKEDFSDFLEKVDDDFYPQEDIQQYMRFSDMKVFRVEDIEKQIIAQPVRISRVEIGKLFVFFDERELKVFDGELVYRLALILGDELRRRNVFKIRHRKRYLNFMWMLLEDKYPNHQVIERAMEELEIDFKGKCCVAVIHAISEKDVAASQNDALNVLSAQIEAKLPDVMWLIYNEELVLLFNLSTDAEIPEYDLSVLQKMAYTNEVSIGISYSFNALVGVRQLYWQAQQAAEFGYEYKKQQFTYFGEVSHFAMFRLVQQNIDPVVLVDPELMRLYSSGKENYREYFITLYYYLKYGGNTSAVAAKAHMHRNTVLYRIEKLQQIMDFDLTNGITTMKLMLSFEILKYLKLLSLDD